MPAKTLGEEVGERERATKAGKLDEYLDEAGAGDDVTLRQGFRRLEPPVNKEMQNGRRPATN